MNHLLVKVINNRHKLQNINKIELSFVIKCYCRQLTIIFCIVTCIEHIFNKNK